MNNKKYWLENIFIALVAFLNIISFISNFIKTINNSIFGNGSIIEYLFLLFYVFPVLIIIAMIKRKTWAFFVTGIWCGISAIYIISTILFTPLNFSISVAIGQFVLVAVLSGVSFCLGVMNNK